MSDEFKYDAFISYSRADAKLVDDFFARLTKYRTPKSLQKKSGRIGNPPPRINVFLDRKSIEAGGTLSGKLREKVQSSKWLIIFCSKHSADRPWVNQEIDLFSMDQGPEYILPIFVRENRSTPFDSVTPIALAKLGEEKPVGADLILDGGIIAVRDKILGAILGFSQDEIAREQELEDQRIRKKASAETTAAMALGATGSAAVGTSVLGMIEKEGTSLEAFFSEVDSKSILAMLNSLDTYELISLYLAAITLLLSLYLVYSRFFK